MFRRGFVVIVCALAVGACGGGGAEDDIRQVVEDYSSGLIEGDAGRACDALTPGAWRQLSRAGSRAGCIRIVNERGRPRGAARRQLEDPEVQDLEVDGDTASALVAIEGSESETRTRFRRVDGRWRIDGQ